MTLPRRPLRPVPAGNPFTPDLSEGTETGLYLALLELFDEGLLITGDDHILEVNSAACRLLGRSYRELAGRPLNSLFADEAAFLAARERMLIHGEARGSLTLALPDGQQRSLRYIAAPRLRPGLHAIILSPDLLGEDGVAQGSDSVWPRLAAALRQPLLVLDAQQHIAAANAAVHGLFGVPREELPGRPLSAFARLADPVPGSSAGGLVLQADPARLHPVRLLPAHRPGWQLCLVEERAHPAQGAEDRRYRQLFAVNPLPMLVCHPLSQRILDANPAAEALYGYAHAELVGLTVPQLWADPDGHPEDALREGGPWLLRHKDGSTFRSDVRIRPLEHGDTPGPLVLLHAEAASPRDLAPAPGSREATLQGDLPGARQRHELDIYFQPLVDVRSNRIVGAEALLRWQHPEFGLLGFAAFGAALRQAGLSCELGSWAMAQACRLAHPLLRQLGNGARLVMNLSQEELLDPQLPWQLTRAIAQADLTPGQVELDLPETLFHHDDPRVARALQTLHGVGVQLAIDDFGVGPTSITTLALYPVRRLKLPQALIAAAARGEQESLTVEAILTIAEALGLEVVAKGVESESQSDFLKALGCQLQQGLYCGEPQDATLFGAHLG